MGSAKNKITFFDLDHTLLPIDSDYAWGEFTQAIGWTDPVEFKRRNDAFFEHYKAGTLDVHDYVRFAVEAIRIRSEAEYREAHARFMREVIRPVVLPAALNLIRRHRAAGDTVAVITATNELVTRPIADALEIEELIAVELERDGAGWITGEISGVPSLGAGKVVRATHWLAQRGTDWLDVETTFYSDSMNDLPLLEQVDHPVATNPDPRLRTLALERGWRVLDLFAKPQ
ncbi:MAG TPA: HAD family hydrolase [Ramlibacter sp.]|uniref:HAD family hydrolase n=1 Tax=Ramlibacter sp. TaxID=1917967 RepID=UPI002C6886A1|nr:HAD family hydrolase [Ramlibacter sp.]HVZ42406.1 HAD family hydrolase [Ramlibacter sp.]